MIASYDHVKDRNNGNANKSKLYFVDEWEGMICSRKSHNGDDQIVVHDVTVEHVEDISFQNKDPNKRIRRSRSKIK